MKKILSMIILFSLLLAPALAWADSGDASIGLQDKATAAHKEDRRGTNPWLSVPGFFITTDDTFGIGTATATYGSSGTALKSKQAARDAILASDIGRYPLFPFAGRAGESNLATVGSFVQTIKAGQSAYSGFWGTVTGNAAYRNNETIYPDWAAGHFVCSGEEPFCTTWDNVVDDCADGSQLNEGASGQGGFSSFPGTNPSDNTCKTNINPYGQTYTWSSPDSWQASILDNTPGVFPTCTAIGNCYQDVLVRFTDSDATQPRQLVTMYAPNTESVCDWKIKGDGDDLTAPAQLTIFTNLDTDQGTPGTAEGGGAILVDKDDWIWVRSHYDGLNRTCTLTVNDAADGPGGANYVCDGCALGPGSAHRKYTGIKNFNHDDEDGGTAPVPNGFRLHNGAQSRVGGNLAFWRISHSLEHFADPVEIRYGSVPCTEGVTGTCTTAPLKIDADRATACVMTVNSVVPDGEETEPLQVTTHWCADSTCTNKKSIKMGAELIDGECAEGGPDVNSSIPAGGQYVYFKIKQGLDGKINNSNITVDEDCEFGPGSIDSKCERVIIKVTAYNK